MSAIQCYYQERQERQMMLNVQFCMLNPCSLYRLKSSKNTTYYEMKTTQQCLASLLEFNQNLN